LALGYIEVLERASEIWIRQGREERVCSVSFLRTKCNRLSRRGTLELARDKTDLPQDRFAKEVVQSRTIVFLEEGEFLGNGRGSNLDSEYPVCKANSTCEMPELIADHLLPEEKELLVSELLAQVAFPQYFLNPIHLLCLVPSSLVVVVASPLLVEKPLYAEQISLRAVEKVVEKVLIAVENRSYGRWITFELLSHRSFPQSNVLLHPFSVPFPQSFPQACFASSFQETCC
jgi:hypothetical protein